MTDEQYVAFCVDLDALCEKHKAIMRGDYNLDSVMLALADCVKREHSHQTHELVMSCLESCADHLGNAAMDYYCSMK
jgi:hypothetical protein